MGMLLGWKSNFLGRNVATIMDFEDMVSWIGGGVIDAAKVLRYYYSIDAQQIAIPTTLSAAEFSHIAGLEEACDPLLLTETGAGIDQEGYMKSWYA